LASIWLGLKKHKINKRYHVESANEDADKQKIFDLGVTPVQAWLMTELPDVFSKDFAVWFVSNFYPQRDRIKPVEEIEYFFSECKHHIQPVRNNKGATSQRMSLTKLHRLSMADGRLVDLQKRSVPKGPNYYQYLYTVRNHGVYDDRPTESYYTLEEEVIKYFKDQTKPISNQTTEDLHKILMRFQVRVAQ
jgi:hypothetical protein